MDLKQIQDLIKFVAKSGVSEVKLEKDDFKITIRTGREEGKSEQPQLVHQVLPQHMVQSPQMHAQQHAPQQTAQNAEPVAKQEKPSDEADDSKYQIIRAPMIGTFYRSPGPDKEPFIKVGDTINKGEVVCIVEAMKLFNEIEAEFSGKVVKILAEDASPVEYDQPLFLVDPS